MTTLPWEDRYTFGGYDLSSYAVMTMNVDGPDLVPPARGATLPRTGMSGNVPQRLLIDQRMVRVGLFITPDTIAGVEPSDNRIGAYSNLDTLKAVLNPARGQKLLTRRMPDGSTRQGMAQVRSTSAFAGIAGGELMMLTVEFELADPYWYAAAPVTDTRAITATPTVFAITNPGDHGHNVTFAFTGPIIVPRVTNTTNGSYLQLNASVASTKIATINVYNFTAVNDITDQSSLIVQNPTGGVPWLRLDPGVNTLSVTASFTPTASLTTTLYPAYL